VRGAAVLLAAALLAPTAAGAQGDPWNPPVGGDRDHGDRFGDRPIYAGDFVIIPKDDQFLLLDSKTGCIWRRETFAGVSWVHEFPAGARQECADRLAQARTNARLGNN
jgi:hypothetical protein